MSSRIMFFQCLLLFREVLIAQLLRNAYLAAGEWRTVTLPPFPPMDPAAMEEEEQQQAVWAHGFTDVNPYGTTLGLEGSR